jgi:hypothetical protein
MTARTTRFAILLFAGGCGAAKPPTYALGQSQAAIRGAEEVGAADVPAAALHLKLARDNLTAAEKLISEQEGYEEAKLLLKRAQADAELAIVLSKEQHARAEAVEAAQKVERLRKEVP